MTPEELLQQTSRSNRTAHQQKQTQQQKIRSRQNPHAVALPYDGDRGSQQIQLSDGSIQEAQTNSNGVIGEGDTVALHRGKGRSRINVMPHQQTKRVQAEPPSVDRPFLFVADQGNNRIRAIDKRGKVSTLAGNGGTNCVDGSKGASQCSSVSTLTSSGKNLYSVCGFGIRKITPKGVVSLVAGSYTESGSVDGSGELARFSGNLGRIAADRQGNIYAPETDTSAIRKIDTSGQVTTLIRILFDTPFNYVRPIALVVGSDSNIYCASYSSATGPENKRISHIFRITPTGILTNIYALALDNSFLNSGFFEIAQHPTSNQLYVLTYIDDLNQGIYRLNLDGSGFELFTNAHPYFDVSEPTRRSGLCFDRQGNLYVAAYRDRQVFKYDSQGNESVFTGSGVFGYQDGNKGSAQFKSLTDITFLNQP
jgi:hypothetical protein